jgi:hypothetical protein
MEAKGDQLMFEVRRRDNFAGTPTRRGARELLLVQPSSLHLIVTLPHPAGGEGAEDVEPLRRH